MLKGGRQIVPISVRFII